jgi:CRP-like cAMP-binding protein
MGPRNGRSQIRKLQPPQKDAIGNDVLRQLLGAEYRHLIPKLETVHLTVGQTLYQADQRIECVYFPEDSVVAMLDTMEAGNTVEVGVIGHEGMVGINVVLGGLTTPDKAIVQLPGRAMRMKTSDLRKELRFGSRLQSLLLRYTEVLLAVISQSVGCSQHHSVPQRLARWLLTMHGYAGPTEIEMSQEFIATMLGARRVGVTNAAGEFQSAGLIAYHRGRIKILDEAGLEDRACECYRFIKHQHEELSGEVPGFLKSRAAG